MKEVIWINHIEQLAVISVPIRMSIFNRIRYEALSPKKLSYELKLSPQNLNYHFQQLQKHAFIYKRYEERKRGAFESFYQAMAPIIRIDECLFNDTTNKNYKRQFHFLDELNKNKCKNDEALPQDGFLDDIVHYMETQKEKKRKKLIKALKDLK